MASRSSALDLGGPGGPPTSALSAQRPRQVAMDASAAARTGAGPRSGRASARPRARAGARRTCRSCDAARSWPAPTGSAGVGSLPCSRSGPSCRRRTRRPSDGVDRGSSRLASWIVAGAWGRGLRCRQDSEGKGVEVGVVHAAAAGAVGRTGRSTRGDRSAGLELAAVSVLAGALLEVHDSVGRDLQRRPLLAVAALELAGLEATLPEHSVHLAEVLLRVLGAVAPDADPEPVGLLDPLPGL